MSEKGLEQPVVESLEKPPKKVLFIDDDSGILAAIGGLYEGDEQVKCAECHSVQDAIDAIELNMPDIIFLDNNFSDEENAGLTVADLVQRKYPSIKIYSTTDSVDRDLLAKYTERKIKRIRKGNIAEIREVIEGK